MIQCLVLCLTLAAPGPTQAIGAATMIAEVVRGGSVIVRGVEFEANANSPSAGSEPALRQLRAMLLEHDEWVFEVQVHTDDGGDPGRDQALSAARAAAVVEWLTRRGIATARLVPRGYGSSRPLAAASAADAGLAHDRVELKKLNEEQEMNGDRPG
jgi:OmpA-OmpF porin, OOP family